MSVYDPKTFAAMTFTGSNSTESIPVPVADWPGTITKQEIVAWQKKDDPTKAGLKCLLFIEIDDPAVTNVTGRPKSTVRHEMMLDLTPEGGLDMSKGMNVKLGRAREACNLNDASRPFAFDMFLGQPVTVSVKHDEYKGQLVAYADALAKPR